MRAVKAAKDAAAEKTEGSDDDEEWNLNVDEHSDGDSDEQFAITASKVPASTKTSPASKDDGRRPQRKLSAQAVSARDRLHVKMATALTFDDPIQRKAAAASGSSDALEVVHSAPAESVDANAAWLTLTSDLSGELPSSFWLDFEVGGVDEATSDGVRLALLVDGAAWTHSERHHVEIAELAPGYHLLRAFLVDRRSGCCVKSRSAYVEAEFRVAGVSAAAAAPRGFMFGQPAICAIARPDPIAWRGGDEVRAEQQHVEVALRPTLVPLSLTTTPISLPLSLVPSSVAAHPHCV